MFSWDIDTNSNKVFRVDLPGLDRIGITPDGSKYSTGSGVNQWKYVLDKGDGSDPTEVETAIYRTRKASSSYYSHLALIATSTEAYTYDTISLKYYIEDNSGATIGTLKFSLINPYKLSYTDTPYYYDGRVAVEAGATFSEDF